MTKPANRRTFLKLGAAAASLSSAKLAHASTAGRRISILTNNQSPFINNEPVGRATQKLRDAVTWYKPLCKSLVSWTSPYSRGGGGTMQTESPSQRPFGTNYAR